MVNKVMLITEAQRKLHKDASEIAYRALTELNEEDMLLALAMLVHKCGYHMQDIGEGQDEYEQALRHDLAAERLFTAHDLIKSAAVRWYKERDGQ